MQIKQKVNEKQSGGGFGSTLLHVSPLSGSGKEHGKSVNNEF